MSIVAVERSEAKYGLKEEVLPRLCVPELKEKL